MKLSSPIITLLTSIGLLFSIGCGNSGSDPGPGPITGGINKDLIAPYLEQPYLDRPAATQPAGWQNTIKKIDEIIAKHPKETVTINQLRVRQAMLLTVNRQENQANQKWAEIEPSALKTERDKALYQSRGALVWAYKTLPQAVEVKAATVNPQVQSIDRALGGVSSTDLEIYLNTVRAQIQLKLANSMDEWSNKTGVENVLATSLQKFVDAFPRADQKWVQANPSGGAVNTSVAEFRHRVWLRELIRAYRTEAKDKELTPPWSPAWVGTLPVE